MSGRPATTIEGQVRSMVKRLSSVNGSMDPQSRLSVMGRLLQNAATEVRYNGTPAPESLIRLAAHCIAWANETEADE